MNDIIFRRMRGRVVPIKLTKEQKSQMKTGAVASAAGVATGLASGKAWKKAMFKSNDMAAKALDVLDLRFPGNPNNKALNQKGLKMLKQARLLAQSSRSARIAGGAAAAALVGFGAAKIARSVAPKESKNEYTAAGASAGAAVGGAAFLFGVAPKAAFKESVKALKPYIAKFVKAKF